MKDIGWIKLHRKFIEWEWYDDPSMVKFFIHLLITVNHKDKKWHGIPIKRGQRIITIRGLAKEMKVSVQVIRTLITRLKSTHELTQQSTHQYTMLTLCNYDDYQQREMPSNTAINTPSNTRATHEQHILKNVKKERTNKIEGKTTPKSSLEWLQSDEYISMMQERYPELDVIPIINKSYYYYQDSGGKTAKGQPIKDFHRAGARWLSGAEDERLKKVAEWKEARRPKFQS